MATKVYRYGLRPPTEGVGSITKQMQLGHRYQHAHTSLSRAQRAAYLEARRRLVPDLDYVERLMEVCDEWIKVAREYVAEQHIQQRSKLTSKEQKALVANLVKVRRGLSPWLTWARQRANLDPRFVKERDAINERDHTLSIALRAAFGPKGLGLHYGTYVPVEQAAEAARKACLKHGGQPAYRPLVRSGYIHFDSPLGDGCVGVQTQRGLPCAAVFQGANRYLRIDPLPADQWATRSGRRHAYTQVHLRMGTDENREPVWGSWPMLMHRPLPADGIIQRADVKRVVRGTRVEWSLLVTVREPEAQLTENPRRVALHAAWRVRPHGIRVAYVVDEEGRKEEVVLRPQVRALALKERGLRVVLGRYRENIMKALLDWFSHARELPEWLQQRTRTLHQWREEKRLVRLAEEWRDKRFAGDEGVFPWLWHYRERWRHLSQWAAGCSRRVVASRREQYRLLAHRLTTEYGVVVVDDTSYAELAKRKPVESKEEELHQQARWHRKITAVGELRETVKNRAMSHGLGVQEAKSEWITNSCHVCGGQVDVPPERVQHTCEHCGSSWDRDFNACRHLLARERAGDTKDLRTARKPRKNSRFDKKQEPEAAE